MTESADIVVLDQHLTLLPQRAVFWREQRLLIVADTHFGKAATFRKSGIAVPEGTTADDLQRLEQSLTLTGAQTLIVLGDLMHAASISGDRFHHLLHRWRQTRKNLQIVLVSGNHDRRAGPPPAEFDLQRICDRLALGPFLFVHHPQQVARSFVFCGHLHPAVQLTGAARQRERLPCFFFGPDYAVLPAFGGFTGYSTVRPESGNRVFVIADKRVVEMPLA
jgi:DNA ligase-associated metallophosphoesterase